jgi:hypothetical protein
MFLTRYPFAFSKPAGVLGSVIATDTQAVSGSFGKLVCLASTVFTTLSAADQTITSGSIAGVTFPAGAEILGYVTNFKLASGKVIAYTIE